MATLVFLVFEQVLRGEVEDSTRFCMAGKKCELGTGEAYQGNDDDWWRPMTEEEVAAFPAPETTDRHKKWVKRFVRVLPVYFPKRIF